MKKHYLIIMGAPCLILSACISEKRDLLDATTLEKKSYDQPIYDQTESSLLNMEQSTVKQIETTKSEEIPTTEPLKETEQVETSESTTVSSDETVILNKGERMELIWENAPAPLTGELLSEEEEKLKQNHIIAIPPGTVMDYDGDGTKEEMNFKLYYRNIGKNSCEWSNEYSLMVGEAVYEGTGEYMYPPKEMLGTTFSDLNDYIGSYVYGMMLGGAENGIQLIVPIPNTLTGGYEYMEVYQYWKGELLHLGELQGTPEDLWIRAEVTGTEERRILTTTVRGRVLCSWYHDEEYYMYFGSIALIREERLPALIKQPRNWYDMGLEVILKKDLPIYPAVDTNESLCILQAGSRAILVGTDDRSRIWVQDAENPDKGGWISLNSGGYKVEVNGEFLGGSEVFDGLFFASE